MDVVSFFDYSGNMVRPWAEMGAECWCLDIETCERDEYVGKGIIHYVKSDIRNFVNVWGAIVFASFFPPCTHLAVSGARWFKGKGLRALAESIELFACAAETAESLDCPYLIENPVSTISTYWRKPDYMFDPCDYGDPYTKKTCLWTGGGFVMPPKRRVEPTEGSKMHQLPPGDDRARIRSETPMGFARAVFEANKLEARAA